MTSRIESMCNFDSYKNTWAVTVAFFVREEVKLRITVVVDSPGEMGEIVERATKMFVNLGFTLSTT
jgi:hypothetical protein